MARSPRRFLSGAKIEIPDVRYKADMDLHDRFQNFSSELLRLSLAGIAVTGVFLTILTADKTAPVFVATIASWPFIASVGVALVGFGASVATALAHRFLASDGMFHHLRAIKLLILTEQPNSNYHVDVFSERAQIRAAAEADEGIRNRKFNRSEWYLYWSAALLVIGAVALAVGFIILLSTQPRPTSTLDVKTQPAALDDQLAPARRL
ncbi:MAG: hypothetical protein V4637_06640 [Pseudomonadota bacterium]